MNPTTHTDAGVLRSLDIGVVLTIPGLFRRLSILIWLLVGIPYSIALLAPPSTPFLANPES